MQVHQGRTGGLGRCLGARLVLSRWLLFLTGSDSYAGQPERLCGELGSCMEKAGQDSVAPRSIDEGGGIAIPTDIIDLDPRHVQQLTPNDDHVESYGNGEAQEQLQNIEYARASEETTRDTLKPWLRQRWGLTGEISMVREETDNDSLEGVLKDVIPSQNMIEELVRGVLFYEEGKKKLENAFERQHTKADFNQLYEKSVELRSFWDDLLQRRARGEILVLPFIDGHCTVAPQYQIFRIVNAVEALTYTLSAHNWERDCEERALLFQVELAKLLEAMPRITCLKGDGSGIFGCSLLSEAVSQCLGPIASMKEAGYYESLKDHFENVAGNSIMRELTFDFCEPNLLLKSIKFKGQTVVAFFTNNLLRTCLDSGVSIFADLVKHIVAKHRSKNVQVEVFQYEPNVNSVTPDVGHTLLTRVRGNDMEQNAYDKIRRRSLGKGDGMLLVISRDCSAY